jgi:acyl-coenzyme A synthetase/AMP-(fatty) acid ligase
VYLFKEIYKKSHPFSYSGEPKAIPWSHVTPLKAAADGWCHMDIRKGDVVAWPTNLGWMMGPWLVYASLLNGASMALYNGSPNSSGFAKFVQVHIIETQCTSQYQNVVEKLTTVFSM